ncbi:MAG: serine hydrolase [Bacteroidales bacterium]|nr:serine hydrolase [Bacteroidales bacterium]
MKRIHLTILAAFALLFISAGAAMAQGYIYPKAGGDWQTARPQKYGFSPDGLEKVTNFVIDSTHATGIVVIVGGEQIYSFGVLNRLSYLASCRKSLLAMLYGKYVENGTIDLTKTMADLGIDDIGGLTPQEKEATVYDLITSRSGVYHPASNDGDSKDKPNRGDKKHGEYFVYNNWDFNCAGAVFEQMTGKNIYDAFGEDIAVPIGMQDWDRAEQKKGGNLKISKFPAYHFYLTVRDMARVGYLMLRDGKWNGRQVISKPWHDRIISVVTPWEQMDGKTSIPRFEYGYMWWLFAPQSPLFRPEYKGAYSARGAMGQYITVIPELDMVVAFKTDAKYKRSTGSKAYFRFLDLLMDAREQ